MTEIENFVSVAKSLAKKAGDLCLELQGHLGAERAETEYRVTV